MSTAGTYEQMISAGFLLPLPGGAFLLAPARDGDRLADLFSGVWDCLPPRVTARIARHWRTGPYAQHFTFPLVELLPTWPKVWEDGCRTGFMARTTFRGHRVC